MEDARDSQALAHWVAREILPFEPLVRAWLARAGASQEDSDDLIQEAYCKIAGVDDAMAHIERPSAFFFQTVRNLFRNQIHRNGIVRIESGLDYDVLVATDDTPSPERIAGDRREYARIMDLIGRLPTRCRQIFEMRKIDGLSQREIAERLNITENVVENEGARGIRMVLDGLREQGTRLADHYEQRRHNRINRK